MVCPIPQGDHNEVALQRAEMRMVRRVCDVKVKDRVPSKELRGRLGIDDIILVLHQNRLRWYGRVLRKEDTDWVKNCTKYEWRAPDQEVDQRGRGERLCKKITVYLNREDVMDCSR